MTSLSPSGVFLSERCFVLEGMAMARSANMFPSMRAPISDSAVSLEDDNRNDTSGVHTWVLQSSREVRAVNASSDLDSSCDISRSHGLTSHATLRKPVSGLNDCASLTALQDTFETTSDAAATPLGPALFASAFCSSFVVEANTGQNIAAGG